MVVGDFQHFIVVPITVQPQGAQHQDRPQIHAGSAILGICIVSNNVLQDCKYFVAGFTGKQGRTLNYDFGRIERLDKYALNMHHDTYENNIKHRRPFAEKGIYTDRYR